MFLFPRIILIDNHYSYTLCKRNGYRVFFLNESYRPRIKQAMWQIARESTVLSSVRMSGYGPAALSDEVSGADCSKHIIL